MSIIDSRSLNRLKFGEGGLIPAVVQECGTGLVLTVAYMNRESLEITLREGRTCFWSRSRRVLWRKGETSGNVQRVVRVVADCDFDALVVEVVKEGPACHLGEESCFHNVIFDEAQAADPPPPIAVAAAAAADDDDDDDTATDTPSRAEAAAATASEEPFDWHGLYELIKSRKAEMPDGSYTTYLFSNGIEKILKKIGEECTEVVIGAMKSSKGETVNELADLCYHALVLMCEMGIDPSDIEAELGRRHISKG